MCLLPAAAPVRILFPEDARVYRRSHGALLFVCDDRPGVLPSGVASEIPAAALTGRRGTTESAMESADQAGAEGVP